MQVNSNFRKHTVKMNKTKTIHILKQCIIATIIITAISSCKNNKENSKTDTDIIEDSVEKPIRKIDEPLVEKKIDTSSFKKSLSFQNIGFEISTSGKGSIQQLTIQPSGLKIDNKKIVLEVVGVVNNAEIGDLNSDGFPEILIYTTSAGSGSYGDVIGYSVNNGKSISQIYFPPIAENKKINEGYSGHDEFSIVKKLLVQRFKTYKTGDSNSNPTGQIREIQYKLKNGEATKEFAVEKVIEFPAK